jgi:hypothetical protein
MFGSAYPDRIDSFCFRDRKRYSIQNVLSQKTETNHWAKVLFGDDGLRRLCKRAGKEIVIKDLRPEQVVIYVDDQPICEFGGAMSVDLLIQLVRDLVGDPTEAEWYVNRYGGQLLMASREDSEGKTATAKSERRPPGEARPPSAGPPQPSTDNGQGEPTLELARPPDVPAPAPSATKIIDFEIERCIVAVKVNGTVAGTGFVVHDGVVVTCAHVVVPEDKTPTTMAVAPEYSIEFLALMAGAPEGDGETATHSAACSRSVRLNPHHFSRKSQNDVAFLTWEGGLPPGVRVGVLTRAENVVGRQCRVKGFAQIRPNTTLVVDPLLIAGTGIKSGGNPVWNLGSANGVLPGHSGAPLLDVVHHEILGMLGAINGAADHRSQHGIEYAFAVTCDTILATWPELFEEAASAEVESHLKSGAEKLRQTMKDYLLRSAAVQREIAILFAKAELVTAQEQTALKLVDAILNERPQVSVDRLATVDSHFRTGPVPDLAAANVVADLYLAFLPAVISRRDGQGVRLVLRQVRGVHQGPVVLPVSSETILSLYLAAIDGKPVGLNQQAAQEKERPTHHILDEIPETGFQNQSVNRQVVLSHIVQQVGGLPKGFGEWSERDQCIEAAERLRHLHLNLRNTKALIVSRSLTPQQEETLREILAYMAIVRLTDGRGEHRHLITPFLTGNFPLPPNNPPR